MYPRLQTDITLFITKLIIYNIGRTSYMVPLNNNIGGTSYMVSLEILARWYAAHKKNINLETLSHCIIGLILAER